MKFKTHYDNDRDVYQRGLYEENSSGVSQTIPGQEMSVLEIMKRYASGIPFSGAKVPIYEGDEIDFPDLNKMDLSEKHQALEDARLKVKDLEKKLKEDLKAQKAQDQQRLQFNQDDQGSTDPANAVPYENSVSAPDRRPRASVAAGGKSQQSTQQSKQQSNND